MFYSEHHASGNSEQWEFNTATSWKFEINSNTFQTFCAYFASFRKDILSLRSQDCSLVIYLLSCLFLSITMLRVNCNSAVVVFLSENRLWPFPDKTWIKCIFIEIIFFALGPCYGGHLRSKLLANYTTQIPGFWFPALM